jgi:hypothetical protein
MSHKLVLKSALMKTAVVLLITMLLPQVQAQKNDPNGTWEAETGTKYRMQLSDADLRVQLVENSSATFVKYEVNLKNAGEVNTYVGTGYFIAKMKSGKECKFDTEWQIVVVQTQTIIGVTSNVIPDPDTCEVKERSTAMISLKKI